MVGSVNKVILLGNLGADPEVRRMGSGDPVVNMRLATSERWRDKQTGETRERTEWHSVVIFNENLCRVAEQYLKKGSKIYIEGQLQTRSWEDRDGNKRYNTEVVLQRFRGELCMLDNSGGGGGDYGGGYESGGGGGSSGGGGTTKKPASGQGKQQGTSFREELDDDIPF